MTEHYTTDVLIIGSGVAGNTAGIYTARAGLNPIIVRGIQPGGQLTMTTDVENYPGFENGILGTDLMETMEKQAIRVGTTVHNDIITAVDFSQRPYTAVADSGNRYTAQSVIICTGATARWLGLESEKKYAGYGISTCATCDGFFYKGKQVAVIGGGNSAVEESLYLSRIAYHVHVIHRRDSFRAEKILQDRLFNTANITVHWHSVVDEFVGDDSGFLPALSGIKLQNTQTNAITDLPVSGAFVAIGHDPVTALFKGQIDLDDDGYIITAPDSTATNVAGVYAAGDVQDKTYRQAITAGGTGCMAGLQAKRFLLENS